MSPDTAQEGRAVARHLAAFGAGILFGVGLCVSQMVNPAKVLAFLDVAGAWDPSLAMVMAGALLVALPGFQLLLRRPRPLAGERFRVPDPGARIDARLLAGATLFGMGWGLAGLCPGPALAAVIAAGWQPLLFVAAMLAGLGVGRRRGD
ncbi:MAG: YeeE/YedE family protein [Gammaproteobacteria bacterium]|nr:YeeE/YedE family protein [Gammaproteobacteria bacterium]